jgi:hypothetical protein
MSDSKMSKARESMRNSPEVKKAVKDEDRAMAKWLSLKDNKDSSKEDVKKAYEDYTKLANKRSNVATSKVTKYAKGGMVQKANCGASMKPTQRKK